MKRNSFRNLILAIALALSSQNAISAEPRNVMSQNPSVKERCLEDVAKLLFQMVRDPQYLRRNAVPVYVNDAEYTRCLHETFMNITEGRIGLTYPMDGVSYLMELTK